VKRDKGSPPRIGWIGSKTNLKNLHILTSPLMEMKKDLDFSLRYICDSRDRSLEEAGWEYVQWSSDSEVETLSCLDIGVMPLEDNDYNRGKCGFKIVQYMAMGIPPVASPVGVNEAIINNGVNGFLARTEEDWERALSLLCPIALNACGWADPRGCVRRASPAA
jgi:glycosyltransferase involved in cell wall biosynthesis